MHTYAPRTGDSGTRTHTPYLPYLRDQTSAFWSLRLTHAHRLTISWNVNISSGIGIRLARMLMSAPDSGGNRSGRLAAAAGCASNTMEVPIRESVRIKCPSSSPINNAQRKKIPAHSNPMTNRRAKPILLLTCIKMTITSRQFANNPSESKAPLLNAPIKKDGALHIKVRRPGHFDEEPCHINSVSQLPMKKPSCSEGSQSCIF